MSNQVIPRASMGGQPEGLNILFVSGHLTPPAGAQFQGLGFWFIGLAAITWSGTVAAKAESTALPLVLGFLAAGSTLYGVKLIARDRLLGLIAVSANRACATDNRSLGRGGQSWGPSTASAQST